MNTHTTGSEFGVVTFNGGCGGRVLAPGLAKAMPSAEIAVGVATADGGSRTGDLRYLFGGVAVGDLRSVLAAVSCNQAGAVFWQRFDEGDSLSSVERTNERFAAAVSLHGADPEAASRLAEVTRRTLDIAREVQTFKEYRLDGHTYGNFVLQALRMHYDDQIVPAVQEASEWLGVEKRVRVIPVTAEPHNLVMYDAAANTIVYGEGKIDAYNLVNPDNAHVWLETGPVRNFIEDDPRKVREIIEASKYAGRPQATPEIIEATASSTIALTGPGSPITSLRPALQPVGIANGLAQQQERGGLWVAVANIDPEVTVPTLTLDRYMEWLEGDVQRPFSYIIHDDPHAELPDAISMAEDGLKIRNARAIGAALASAHLATFHPRDPVRHLRAKRHTNPYKVVDAIQRILQTSPST